MSINIKIFLNTDNNISIPILIDKVIGEGKTSTVYLAYIIDINGNKINHPYALKIQDEPIKDISISQISNRCNCVPYVYYSGTINKSYATLIEYFDNAKPLNKFMYRGNKVISYSTAIRIGLIMLDNLHRLHNCGLEYPDLSPANIACIYNSNYKSLILKLYDFDALRIPSHKYSDKVGKQHESFYSTFEKRHTYVDDICSLIFVLLTLLGGTFWNFKHVQKMAQQGLPFFARFNALAIDSKEPYIFNKYDVSPLKMEFRRLIGCIKRNVYNTLISDIKDFVHIKPDFPSENIDHCIFEELIRKNFSTIHNYLCSRYLTINEVKYRSVVGLYLLAVYLTEYSYNMSTSYIDESLYTFVAAKLRYLNGARISNLGNTLFFYDYKINFFLIGNDRIYKNY